MSARLPILKHQAFGVVFTHRKPMFTGTEARRLKKTTGFLFAGGLGVDLGFGILLAIFPSFGQNPGGPLLIGLEEPEMALHPVATGVLLSALREASVHTQILVTSHSPHLLEDADIPTDSILAVDNQEGVTWIAPIDEAGRSALKDRLFTAGELLRQNQLTPDPAARIEDRQLELYDLAGQ